MGQSQRIERLSFPAAGTPQRSLQIPALQIPWAHTHWAVSLGCSVPMNNKVSQHRVRSRAQLNLNNLRVGFRKKHKKSRPKVQEASLLWSTTTSWLEGMKELQWRHKGNQWSWDRTYEREWNVTIIPSELLCNVSSTQKLNPEREVAFLEVTEVIKELLCFVGIMEAFPNQKFGCLLQPISQQSPPLGSNLLQELSHPSQASREHFLILPRTLSALPHTELHSMQEWLQVLWRRMLFVLTYWKAFKKPRQLIFNLFSHNLLSLIT